MDTDIKQKILWIRIALWAGIVADAAAVVLMMSPRLFVQAYGLNLAPDTGFGWGLLCGVPLMAGWTVLLFWVDRKPVERRDILLMTMFPVVAGFVAVEVYAIVSGYSSLAAMLPTFLMQTVLLALFWNGYRIAKTESDEAVG